VTIAVLRELQVPALAEHARCDVTDGAPRVEPTMEQAQLKGTRLDLGEAQGGTHE
jgi:hypothetical protein